MSDLLKWSPFATSRRTSPFDSFLKSPSELMDSLDRMFQSASGTSPIRVEEFIDGKTFVVRAELPGIDPDKNVEVTISDGSFTCELRGLTQALQQTVGEVYTPDCRAELGDARCQVDLGAITQSTTVGLVSDSATFTTAGPGGRKAGGGRGSGAVPGDGHRGLWAYLLTGRVAGLSAAGL